MLTGAADQAYAPGTAETALGVDARLGLPDTPFRPVKMSIGSIGTRNGYPRRPDWLRLRLGRTRYTLPPNGAGGSDALELYVIAASV